MTFLKGYIYTLCCMMVIFSVIFTVVPGGETKKTLRAVIGIIMALIIMSPFFTGDITLPSAEFEKTESLIDEQRAEDMEQLTLTALEKRVESEMEAELEEKGKSDARVQVKLAQDGMIEEVKIKNATEADKQIISEKYGFNAKRIESY